MAALTSVVTRWLTVPVPSTTAITSQSMWSLTESPIWLDASLKVSDASKQRWGYGNSVNRGGDGETNVRDAVFGAGGRYTDSTGTKVVFNTPETIAGYEWLKDVYTNPKWAPALPPGVNAWTDPSNNQAFLAGTVGYTRNGGTVFAQANTDQPDVAKDTFFVPVPLSPVLLTVNVDSSRLSSSAINVGCIRRRCRLRASTVPRPLSR